MARVGGIFSFCGVLALLALAGEVVRSQQIGGGAGGFVRVVGTQFVLGGSPFLFNGFNSYWMMHAAAEPSERLKVSDVFREAATAGLSVCRTWAFSDGGDRALQLSPGVYDERMFQGLDFVVSEARSNGIRLILSLVNNFNDFGGRQQYVQWASNAGVSIMSSDDFYTNAVVKGYYKNHVKSLDFVVSEARRYGIRLILSLVNNFDDFGGRQQYVQWAGSAGISINSDDDFYTNTVVKGYYRNHVKRVVTRYNTITKVMYKDDPTIMAWELINEPRCQADYSGRTVDAWAQEMAAYTKSLDSNHLLEVGMEGFYGDSTPEKQQYNPGYQVGTDFISTNLISEVDFATIHAYPDIWLSGQTDGSQDSFVQRWMWSHWQDAMKMLKKPLVFAEFGKSKKDPGYTIAERNVYIDIVYGDIYNFARSGGAFGGGLVWQIMAEGMDSYYDGYEIVLSQDVTTDGVIARQSHLMTALSHTLSRPHGSTLGAAAELKAAQELSGQQPHAVHRSSSRSLRRHGRRLGRPARSETPPSK